VDDLALNTWKRFDESYLDDALDVEQQCYCRYAVEVSDLPDALVHATDCEVLQRFYGNEWTPELAAQLVRVFEFSRGLRPYRDYWFFNIDKIILGEYPLEKIPEHLHDIVKEARAE